GEPCILESRRIAGAAGRSVTSSGARWFPASRQSMPPALALSGRARTVRWIRHVIHARRIRVRNTGIIAQIATTKFWSASSGALPGMRDSPTVQALPRQRLESVDATVRRIAAAQHGVATRRQLLDAGIAAHRIEYRVASGRLRQLHRGVYSADRKSVVEGKRVRHG